MSGRLFIWNANAKREWPFENNGGWGYPWTVTAGRPLNVSDFVEMFKTLPEAHNFAMAHSAAEAAE